MKNAAFILLMLFSLNAFSQFSPVNKNASPEAKKLLAYLYSLNGNQTLTGQHTYPPNFDQWMDTVKSMTGKYPAVWGCDFILDGLKDWGPEIVQEAIKKYRDRFIVTLMWHAGRPMDDPPYGWKESIQGKLTMPSGKSLLRPVAR